MSALPAPPRLGFIGFGEAARALAEGFLGEGLSGIVACDLRERPPLAGVEMLPGMAEVIAASDVIIAAVTSATAEGVAGDAAKHLTAGKVYMDINSTAPMVKQRMAETVNTTGADFIEVAVMAGVPGRAQKVPMLLCGPRAADVIAAFSPYHVNMRDFGADYGRAAATKMFRSVLVKGLEALLQECLLGAETYGVSNEVFKAMAEGYGGLDWEKVAHFLIGRTAIHGERRAHELEEAAETLRDLGYQPFMCEAGAKRIAWGGSFGLKEKFGDTAPETFHEVVAAINEARKAAS